MQLATGQMLLSLCDCYATLRTRILSQQPQTARTLLSTFQLMFVEGALQGAFNEIGSSYVLLEHDMGRAEAQELITLRHLEQIQRTYKRMVKASATPIDMAALAVRLEKEVLLDGWLDSAKLAIAIANQVLDSSAELTLTVSDTIDRLISIKTLYDRTDALRVQLRAMPVTIESNICHLYATMITDRVDQVTEAMGFSTQSIHALEHANEAKDIEAAVAYAEAHPLMAALQLEEVPEVSAADQLEDVLNQRAPAFATIALTEVSCAKIALANLPAQAEPLFDALAEIMDRLSHSLPGVEFEKESK